MPASAPEYCRDAVSWWEGEYEGECSLPAGHEGDHCDGLSWWDEDGEGSGDEHVGEPMPPWMPWIT